jgi:Cu/Ag efflux protein CusF
MGLRLGSLPARNRRISEIESSKAIEGGIIMGVKLLHIALVATVALSAAALGCSKSAAERRAASPTFGERVKQDSVTGRVHDIGAKYVSIKETDGVTTRVRVDDHTKMDRVAVGDQVKAYISEDGYATTIQRVSD